ncbi:MAG: APC family permease [Thermoplasmatales archaeon]
MVQESTNTTSDETKKLKQTIGLWGLVSIGIIGAYPMGVAVVSGAGFVVYGGTAAPLVLLFGALMILFFSAPILEYARIAKFNGGYYGLAELGFGRAVGKYVAMTNLEYLLWWNIVAPAAVGFVIFTTAKYVFGYIIPGWIFILIMIAMLVLIFVFTVISISLSVKALIVAAVVQILTVAIFAIYIIIKAPYNSLAPFSIASSPGGLSSLFLGVVVSGFLSYTNYGNPLFFTEEGRSSFRDAWRAMVLIIVIFTAVGLIGTYSMIATINPKNVSLLASDWNPAYVSYFPIIGFFAVFIYILISLIMQIVACLTPGMASARMFFALSRDGFIKSRWFQKIDSKRGTPINGAIANFVIGIVLVLAFEIPIFLIYGNSMGAFYSIFLSGSMGVAIWFFHHIIPDLAFPVYLKKNNLKILTKRYIVTALLAPAGAVILFVTSLYYGYSNLVEPYLVGFILAMALILFNVVYVFIKWKHKTLGISYVTQLIRKD